MALGVSGKISHTLYNDYYISKHGYSYVDIYYQEEYDVATNSSVIKITQITFSHSKYGGSWSVYGSVTINGTSYPFSGSIGSGGVIYNPITSNSIYHDDATGAKSINISTAVNTVGGSGGTQFYEGNHGTASINVALTTIPRSSTISATDANVEAVSSITVVKKTSSYTHSIKYQFGSLSGYINADGSVSDTEVKLSETSIGFTVPADFYTQIKNEKTGVCTLSVTTYSGSAKIGDAKTCTFTVTAAEANCAPIVSGTVMDANIKTQELTGDPNILVRFFSEAVLTLTAIPQHGSTIMEKYIAGKEVTSDLLLIPAVETNSFFFRAVDSRGYAGTATVVKNMVPYIRLTNNASCDRTDATSGNALLKLKGNYFDGSFGAADNEITAKYKVNDSEYVSITDSLTIADNAYTAEIALSGLDYQSVHTIEVVLSDKLNEAVKKTITVGKGEPVVAWGDDFFKVYGDLKVNGELSVDNVKADNVRFSNNIEAKNIKVNGDLITAKPVAPRNLLDNSDFRNPVNQRGQSDYSFDSGYTIDRWKLHWTGDGFLCINDGYISLGRIEYSAYLFQNIPMEMGIMGKIVTVVAKVRGKGAVGFCFNDGAIRESTSFDSDEWQIITKTITVPYYSYSNTTLNGVELSTHLDSTVDIEWAALYEGEYTVETLPPYIPKGYGAELIECMRYYWHSQMVYRSANNSAVSNLNIQFPVRMRIAPTIKYSVIEGVDPCSNQGGMNVLHCGCSFYDAPNNNFTFQAISASADL